MKVRDGDNQRVSGATVTGMWSGAFAGSATAVSNPGGNATFETAPLFFPGVLTFTLTSVSHPDLTYTPALNLASSVTIPSPI